MRLGVECSKLSNYGSKLLTGVFPFILFRPKPPSATPATTCERANRGSSVASTPFPYKTCLGSHVGRHGSQWLQ